VSAPRLWHLAGRFGRSLWPFPPRRRDVVWVGSVLTSAEMRLWCTQQRADRRESIAVARRAQRRLAGTEYAGEPVWLAAALLHDVGKRDAHLGTLLRTVATVVGASGAVAPAGAHLSGLRRRVGAYLLHPEVGADLIRASGGRSEVAVWAGAHHRRSDWESLDGMPAAVAVVLAMADGEPTAKPG